MARTIAFSLAQALALCEEAAKNAGARAEAAKALALACVAAEAEDQPALGLSHFVDYLDALRAGRIDGQAWPEIARPAGAFFQVDAKGGTAHLGFDLAFGDLVATARDNGIAVFSQRNAFTCGALGYFVRRLADQGLVALAATNGPALMAGSGGTEPVFCTNPVAFAAPRAGGSPVVIDQASSAAAFVAIRAAAGRGEPIPAGWALDADGRPTTDAAAALKGVLLAAGGPRGANIALMVEILAAGLTGANWSLDAPSFLSGSQSPGTGLFILALQPKLLDPDFENRMAVQLTRLERDFSVHIPGARKSSARQGAEDHGLLVDAETIDRITQSR